MEIYRAANKVHSPIPAWQCWGLTRHTAVAYIDNPGFGGRRLFKAVVDEKGLKILDLRGVNEWQVLSDILGYDVSALDYPFIYYIWETSRYVRQRLASLYDGIIYCDDYPFGGCTVVFTKDTKAEITEQKDIVRAYFKSCIEHQMTDLISIIKNYENSEKVISEIGNLGIETPTFLTDLRRLLNGFMKKCKVTEMDKGCILAEIECIKDYHKSMLKGKRTYKI